MTNWMPITGFESYEVSDDGRVRFLGGERQFGSRKKIVPPKERRLVQNRVNRYMYIVLSNRSKRSTKIVHRLVAQAFIQKIPGKDFVNHKNGNRHDNRALNLEWVTCSENLFHKTRVLCKSRGEDLSQTKLTEQQVLAINASSATAAQLAARYNVSNSSIRNIRSGLVWGWLTSR